MEEIKITSANKNNNLIQITRDFIRPYEKFCVQLVEKLNQKDENVQIVVREIDDDFLICGLFYFSDGGTILPFFLEKDFYVEQAVKKFFSEKSVFCVSGEQSSVDFVLQIIQSLKKQQIKDVRDFFLMTNKSEKNVEIKKDGFYFRQGTKDDSDFLFPLQIAYIREEVLPDGVDINLPAERFAMDRLLKKGKIYVIVDENGMIVCKAQINGESDSCNLIGGVFTAESFRKNGLALFMMKSLINKSSEENKTCVLFVNKINDAAMGLYEKSGFSEIGKYKIVYIV